MFASVVSLCRLCRHVPLCNSVSSLISNDFLSECCAGLALDLLVVSGGQQFPFGVLADQARFTLFFKSAESAKSANSAESAESAKSAKRVKLQKAQTYLQGQIQLSFVKSAGPSPAPEELLLRLPFQNCTRSARAK